MHRPAEGRAAPQPVGDVGAGAAGDQKLDKLEILVDGGLMQRRAVAMYGQERIDVGARADIADRLWGSTPLGWAMHQGKSRAQAVLERLTGQS